MINNKITNKEYCATQTNSVSCYKNLERYTTTPCSVSKIFAPTPVTVVPTAGNLMRPHKIPNLNSSQFNLSGYKKMNDMCSTNPIRNNKQKQIR